VLSAARMRSRMSAVLLLLVAAFGLVATQATPAEAMTTFQYSVLHEAARHKGQPYVYGAAGPTRFDCSGFTKYVFSRFGRTLPHSSARQYSVVHHISKAYMRPGDLIFFRNSSGTIYHVAIYAGSGKMWHAPHSGSYVKLASIYSSHYSVGRV
jgi:cell wall-associated NlpC family hydrolase